MFLLRHRLLGCGGFGTVELVQETKTGKMFALKTVSKGYAAWTNQYMNASISDKCEAGRC